MLKGIKNPRTPSKVGLPIQFRQCKPLSTRDVPRTEPSSKITTSGCRLEEGLFVLVRTHLHRHLPGKRIVGAGMKFFDIAVGRHGSPTVRKDRGQKAGDTVGLDGKRIEGGTCNSNNIGYHKWDARKPGELIHRPLKLSTSHRSLSLSYTLRSPCSRMQSLHLHSVQILP